MAADLTRLCLVLSLLVVAQSGWCQGVVDPTRPPASPEWSESQARDVGPVLESVLIPSRGKPVAWISGQRVELGQNYGDARLVRLTESEAVLRGPQGESRLQLTPAVDKQPVTDNRKKTRAGEKQ